MTLGEVNEPSFRWAGSSHLVIFSRGQQGLASKEPDTGVSGVLPSPRATGLDQ